MKTVLECETCIYGYLAIDGAGYYCSQPEHKKIECVKTKLADYVAQLKTNKPSDASSEQTVICDFCGAEGLSVKGEDKPTTWLEIEFNSYFKFRACDHCAKWIAFMYAMISQNNGSLNDTAIKMLKTVFPNFKKIR